MIGLIYTFHCMSIRMKLILSFAVIVIIPVLVSLLFSYKIVSDIMLEKISNADIDSMNRTSKRVDRLFDDITYTLLYISSNPDFINILKSDCELVQSGEYGNSDQEDIYNKYVKMANILEKAPITLLMYSSKITVLSISDINYANWEGFYQYAREMKNSVWHKELMSDISGSVTWIGANQYPVVAGMYQYAVEAGIPVKETSARTSNIGVVHIGLDESVIHDILQSDHTGSTIYMVDTNGTIISCEDKSRIGTSFGNMVDLSTLPLTGEGWYIAEFDGSRLVVTYSIIRKTGWKVVSIMPYATMLKPIIDIKNILIVTNLIFIIAFIFIATIISRSISKPVILLNQKIKKVEHGDYSERVNVKYNDEIGNLSRNFNRMLDKVCELLEVTKAKEKQKREAELEALQAQINPHFLFNTLSSIRWTAATNGDLKVEEMALSLSNLLKMTINKGPNMIPLREEYILLGHYVNLCRMKQQKSFDFELNLDSQIADTKVPRLILQPLIENSIIHGFERKRTGGLVKVSGHLCGNDVIVEVEDNGKGFDADGIDEILNSRVEPDRRKRSFNSIGLKNVNDRIKLSFGEEYGLTIENIKSGGALVTVRISFTRGCENHVEGSVSR